MYLNGTWKSKNDAKRLYIYDFENTQFSINDEKTCIIFNLLSNWSRKNSLDDNVLEHSVKQSLERITINERFLHGGKTLFKTGRPFIWEYCLEKIQSS